MHEERTDSRGVHGRRLRRRELRLMLASTVAFGGLLAVTLPGVWPLMPFPQLAPVEIGVAAGLAFGFLLRRWWSLALPLTILVAVNPPDTGASGAIVALLIVGPFSSAGLLLGVLAGQRLQRAMLRRAIAGARPPHTVDPIPADATIAASRAEPVRLGH